MIQDAYDINIVAIDSKVDCMLLVDAPAIAWANVINRRRSGRSSSESHECLFKPHQIRGCLNIAKLLKAKIVDTLQIIDSQNGKAVVSHACRAASTSRCRQP